MYRLLMYLLLLIPLLLSIGCEGGSGRDRSSGPAPDTVETGIDAAQPDEAGVPDVSPGDAHGPELALDVAEDGQVVDVAPDSPVEDGGEQQADPQCMDLEEGENPGFMVDGEERSFLLAFPDNIKRGGPWPVVFNWHGFGDTADNMHQLLASSVDDERYSFILVTPEDTAIPPPGGVDWDILSVEDSSMEVRLFEEILACLEHRFEIDPERIHSVGFSAGAVAADLLGVAWGDQLASLVTYSGAYFANPQNVEAIGMLGGFVSWPEMTTDNNYAQLMLHGGPRDWWGQPPMVIHFDQMAVNDADFLNARGHDLIFCDHGSGHTVPMGVRAPQILEFFAAHPRGTVDSPFVAEGLPEGFPEYCTMRPGD